MHYFTRMALTKLSMINFVWIYILQLFFGLLISTIAAVVNVGLTCLFQGTLKTLDYPGKATMLCVKRKIYHGATIGEKAYYLEMSE